MVSMFDFGNHEVFGSIPTGGIYFSASIWHHFSMPESTLAYLSYIMSFSILHKFKKSI